MFEKNLGPGELLDVEPGLAWERVGAREGAGERPLARDPADFRRLHAERAELYETLADAIVPVPGARTAGLLEPALVALAGAPRGSRLLWAGSASGEYPVLIGRGLLEAGGAETVWPLDRARSRAFCVSTMVAEGFMRFRTLARKAIIGFPG